MMGLGVVYCWSIMIFVTYIYYQERNIIFLEIKIQNYKNSSNCVDLYCSDFDFHLLYWNNVVRLWRKK